MPAQGRRWTAPPVTSCSGGAPSFPSRGRDCSLPRRRARCRVPRCARVGVIAGARRHLEHDRRDVDGDDRHDRLGSCPRAAAAEAQAPRRLHARRRWRHRAVGRSRADDLRRGPVRSSGAGISRWRTSRARSRRRRSRSASRARAPAASRFARPRMGGHAQAGGPHRSQRGEQPCAGRRTGRTARDAGRAARRTARVRRPAGADHVSPRAARSASP